MIPTEVHINLLVHDADAAGPGLRAAALKLLRAGERSAGAEADYFYRAYYCVLALADLYERFETLSLDNEAEAANALPALCGNWRYLLGDLEAEEFPALAMLSADSVAGDLVEETLERRSAQGERVLQFLVERGENGEWAAAVDALPEPSLADDALALVWGYAQQIVEWVRSRTKKASVGGPSVDPALPAPTA